MARPPAGDGDDGIRVVEHRRAPRYGARLVAAGVIAAVVGGLAWRQVRERTGRVDSVDATMHAASTADPGPGGRETLQHDRTGRRAASGIATAPQQDGADPTPDLSDYVLPGEAPDMRTVIAALHRRGIHTGLGAFPPPGTSPPLLGLEVPPDFVLPPGYVRHHQATDDGQRIAPILMFSPDIDAIDIRGRRVPIPADRVVPPDLAPPGMPLNPVRIPPPRDPGT